MKFDEIMSFKLIISINNLVIRHRVFYKYQLISHG